MNFPLIALLVLALVQSDTTALVEAAKDAKARRKTGGRRVITNADLARSRGKIIQRKPEDLPPLPPVESLIEKHEAERKAKALLEEQVRVLDEAIAALEKEVAMIEQIYFETHDLDYRDKELVARFTEAKAKLDKVRAEREALVPDGAAPAQGGAAAASAAEVQTEIRRPERPPLH